MLPTYVNREEVTNLKKKQKKLTLHKETLLNLSAVTGGATTATQTCANCNNSCDCSTGGPLCPDPHAY
jgi:hypothetical protein